MNETLFISSNVQTRADEVLVLKDQSSVHNFISNLTKQRQLQVLIRDLNADVLGSDPFRRDKAVAALKLMGFWNDFG